jgi:glycosyltransferase involved in cell wall biosynthesis
MRLAVWSPLPPARSGIADHVAEVLPALARRVELVAVAEDPGTVDPVLRGQVRVIAPGQPFDADLEVYHLGNSPAHTFVYRAALRRPGVVVLHEWSLHDLVLREALERDDPSGYRSEARRAHGETGAFVARQVLRGLGRDLLPALLPLNDRVLEGCLGVVATSEFIRDRAARRVPARPVRRLPLAFAQPQTPVPTREEARRRLGLPAAARVVTAPGLATAAKRLDSVLRVAGRLRDRWPALRLVVAGEVEGGLPLESWARAAGLEGALVVTGRLDPGDFLLQLVAADVVLCLRFPSHGEMSGALVRALGLGRVALVTAGTPAAEEFPEGVVVPVDPGPAEERELEALLEHLLARPDLRETIGRLAREHVRRAHGLEDGVERLLDFLAEVLARKEELSRAIAAEREAEGTMLGYFLEEVRRGARELGLHDLPGDLQALVGSLARR